MIEIALIMEQEEDRERFSHCLKGSMEDCNIHAFAKLHDFSMDQIHYDLVFADVLLGSERIFSNKAILSAKADYLLFASMFPEYYDQAYMPKSVGFVQKQKEDIEICRILNGIYEEYIVPQARIRIGSSVIKVNARKAMYLVKEGKDVMVYFEGGKQINMGRLTLPQAAMVLKGYCLKANRSIYINPAYIVQLTPKELRLLDCH